VVAEKNELTYGGEQKDVYFDGHEKRRRCEIPQGNLKGLEISWSIPVSLSGFVVLTAIYLPTPQFSARNTLLC
jgi:hypothetical protein